MQNISIEKLKSVFNFWLKVSTFVGGSLSFFLYLFAGYILPLWLGDELPSMLVESFQVLIVGNAIAANSILPYTLLLGTGNFRISAFFSILSGLFVIIATLCLVPFYGVFGAAFAKLAFIPVSVASRMWLLKKIFRQNNYNEALLHFVPTTLCYIVVILFFPLFSAPVFYSTLLVRVFFFLLSTSLLGLLSWKIYDKCLIS
jgi:O-antigen/teichoic acid export membrane protein